MEFTDPAFHLYVLTYNLPRQFELWCTAFQRAYGEVFTASTKYVINNTDDLKVRKEYVQLFERYGFEEIRLEGNTGICGGRYLAADHFHNGNGKYMLYFEDDMLMHAPSQDLCKSGFATYHHDLFSKCIEILETERLDFLKLSFSEVEGDNHTNWAYYNLPSAERSVLFPDQGYPRPMSVKVHYTHTIRGLAYGVGEYHYCNWPILFNKAGNRKIFIEHPLKYKYEQHWGNIAFRLMKQGQLSAGCLLLSPVNHCRMFDYAGESRQENEYDFKLPG